MRRDFKLPEGDERCLNARGTPWETVLHGSVQWLLVQAFQIPAGYNCDTATVALRIPPNYPTEQIDMAYFEPHLSLKSGKAIGALTSTTIDGRSFQQWSRHRTAQNPWRVGEDDVCSHLLQASSWLKREL